ncbi:MAG: hypothetical protein GY696_00680, partial [Gammaproteobacteria bacterium]|nr:hypothetical protein [Gammaproteobacteria bacterium]
MKNSTFQTSSLSLARKNHAYFRYKYQGLVPPMMRTSRDFDPGAKFHVDDNVPYIRYFVSFVVQFQFHKALCQAAGYTGDLSKCDIYKNKAAGTRLLNMLTLGSSRTWPYAMNVITQNTSKMDAGPLMEYFAPLMKWLQTQNAKNNACFGWGYTWPSYYNLSTPRCPANFAAQQTTTQPPKSTTITTTTPKRTASKNFPPPPPPPPPPVKHIKK